VQPLPKKIQTEGMQIYQPDQNLKRIDEDSKTPPTAARQVAARRIAAKFAISIEHASLIIFLLAGTDADRVLR
jgi:hypothetical protein